MPFRKTLRRIRKSFSSGSDALPSRSLDQSSAFVPIAPASNQPSTSSGGVTDSRSGADAGARTQDSTTSPGAQEGIPLLVITGPTSEVTPLSQQGSAPDLGQVPTQLPSKTSETISSPSQSSGVGSWTCLKAVVRVLEQSARVFGPLKAVVDELVACIEIYERAANGRNEFMALRNELEGVFAVLQHHLLSDVPPTITATMESLCESIRQELDYVQGREGQSTTRRTIQAGEDADGVLACYRRIQGHLQRLKLNTDLSAWIIIDEQATETRLDRLRPSMSACYNSSQATELKRGACTPSTRVNVLGGMHAWVYNRDEGSVYWLNGMAGTGKTTIAYSLCAELDAAHNLGASFFCSRTLPECRDVNRIVPSIAYQLARFSQPFRWALSHVLERQPDVHTQLLRIQFDSLVVKPLAEVRETLPQDLVVVIDALDECDSRRSTGRILEVLLTETTDLPIKFFIASRPEPEIRNQMDRWAISRLVLHELDKDTVQGDIEKYLRTALGPIDPAELEIAELVQRAGILFIYAATVAQYIGHANFTRNPRKRLENVLGARTAAGNNPYKDIDELYALIMQAALDDPDLDDEEKDDMKQVLYAVLCAREPLSIDGLSGLLGLHDIERVHAALQPLWSVLHIAEASGPVTTLHTSFPDYMFDTERSKSYCCDVVVQDQALARYCFDCIRGANPQFNICRLESSYVRDEEILNLSARVQTAISSELSYACRYWAIHLSCAELGQGIRERLEDFLSARLLFWMEVMNLNKSMQIGVEMLQQVEGWCRHQLCSEELTQLIHDAWRFATAFTSSPVSQSTPHIYVSMLPFWPKSSPIARHYASRMRGMIQVKGTAMERRNLALLTTWPINREVTSVAWSRDSCRIALVADSQIFVHDSITGEPCLGPLNQPMHRAKSIGLSSDGTRIVSGFQDGTICVWDAQNGSRVLEPFSGHTGSVNSVSFSPDCARIFSRSAEMAVRVWETSSGSPSQMPGPLDEHLNSINSISFSSDATRIVSGSADKTIRMWDAHSGQAVLGPLEGHTGAVSSVAFSPDGTRIVSGSQDRTICMWDAQSGQMLLGPLKGHTTSVTSVAFSPDGTRMISGSDYNTMRMWDAQSGQMVLGLLEGHTNSVKPVSAAFSPDRTRIVSGFNDKTVRMWDAQSKQTVIGPLEGHTGVVWSVAFSPDGTHVVSGSGDNTIRMWNAQCGQPVLSPFQGHTSPVTSVAFSPDGTRIISGSDDTTMRLWDAQSGQTVLGPLDGHTDSVSSIAFSPDGTRIVSGSNDKTIRLWDAQSGQTVLGPLKGHTDSVSSVGFSPDSTRIVSGSDDQTIRMWDAQSGQTVLDPLQGHTGAVNAVGFSPDGTRIVSGSDDNTIRMWDAHSGQTIFDPLKGHTSPVYSVAFSPDGTRIISGSWDCTIRMWDAQSGQTMLGPIQGHTNLVSSVTFSPNGIHILSGSGDSTICMWDAQNIQEPSSSSPSPDPTSCSINSDGWLLDRDNDSRILLWIPSDLRSVTSIPSPKSILKAFGHYVHLIFDDPCIGESWAECYRPVDLPS